MKLSKGNKVMRVVPRLPISPGKLFRETIKGSIYAGLGAAMHTWWSGGSKNKDHAPVARKLALPQ